MQNANPELAKDVVARRAELSNHDYLAYCSMCRDNLARVGKRTMHLLDLFLSVRRRCRSGRPPKARMVGTPRKIVPVSRKVC
jgi:hypothetical protein